MCIQKFRGQYGTKLPTIHTRLPSISFGSLKSATIYSNRPNNPKDAILKSIVLSAVLHIRNPIITSKDCFADFGLLTSELGTDFMWCMAEIYKKHIYLTDNWEDNYSEYKNINNLRVDNPKELTNLYLDAYVLLDDKDFIYRSVKLGYDGAINAGNGCTSNDIEYRVFSLKQVTDIKEVTL